MARPRSEDKRLALLDAATEELAVRGLAAPTSRIAKRAGVAEGTLFRYFPTKDDLLNELYLHIKRNMSEAMSTNYEASGPLQQRAQVLWENYIDWGLANPEANKAINQLEVSEVLKPAVRAKGVELFPDSDLATGFTDNTIFSELPEAFADALFVALADTTMNFATRDPKRAKAYKACGFEAMWAMYGKA